MKGIEMQNQNDDMQVNYDDILAQLEMQAPPKLEIIQPNFEHAFIDELNKYLDEQPRKRRLFRFNPFKK